MQEIDLAVVLYNTIFIYSLACLSVYLLVCHGILGGMIFC